ncbi:hypothetical protein PRIPAC_80015, partial [Pristionchus pacificus]|uniref:G protein-coupled receptor n=1 Tax=Pristionchus pacificus TaxID=54126 RepID=A0A2A6CJ50_PRIPA
MISGMRILTVCSFVMEKDAVSTAYFVVHSISLFGFISNSVAVVTIYKKRDLHTPFGILCAAIAVNNAFVLTMNSSWYALPDDPMFESASKYSRLIGYVGLSQWNFGCKIHLLIALNRLLAVVLSMNINNYWTQSRNLAGMVIILVLGYIQNTLMLIYKDIWFCYDRQLMMWFFAKTERGRFFETKINNVPCYLDFTLTITFDLITLTVLRVFHSKAFSQSLPEVNLYTLFMFVTPILTTNFSRFLSTTFAWHLALGVD